ncbi:MAG: LysM peptidoglycan-binding domain-containing protein, partial [Acidimicrobiales bacterium]
MAILGDRSLQLPHALSWRGVETWVSSHGASYAAFAALWLLAMAAGAYSTLLAGLSLAACALHSPMLARVAGAIALPGFRWMLATGLSASLTVGLAGGVAGASPTAPSPPVMRYVGPVSPSTGAVAGPTGAVPVPAGPSTQSPPEGDPAPAPSPGTASSSATYSIQPGDNLWSVAEDALAAAWGRAPSSAQICPYWWEVVQVNRAHLPYPSDPDLVFAG